MKIADVARLPLRGVLVDLPRLYFRHVRSARGKRALWRLAEHTWWLETDRTARTCYGASLRVNGRDIVGRYISYFGTWEPNLTAWLRETLRPGDVFVDVGANIGYFTLLASRLVGPTGGVVAVEAVPGTARTLRDAVRRNRASNVRVVEAAAWDERGELDIYCHPDQTTGTATAVPGWAEHWDLTARTRVPARPLSEILTVEEAERARVVKVDVEGAELHAIRGLPDLPAADIMVEVAPAMVDWPALQAELDDYRWRVLENDYSPAAYWTHEGEPAWLDAPREGCDQFDVVFSR